MLYNKLTQITRQLRLASADYEWYFFYKNIEVYLFNNPHNITMNFNILTCLTTDHEVAGSISGTSINFKYGLGLEWGPPSLMETIG